MDRELFERLRGGAICVTATERLADATRKAYGRAMADLGASAWPVPEALSWSAWVRGLWEALWRSEAVAPSLPARVLWEEIISEDAAGNGMELLDTASTAGAAAEAENLISLYSISVDSSFEAEEETRAFRRWRESYASELAERGWVGPETLETRLAGEFARRPPKPGEAVLLGFDEEPPPARKTLLDTLLGAGWRVTFWRAPTRDSNCGRMEFADAEAEAKAAVLWAGGILLREPKARIGIVTVRAEEARPLLERMLPSLLTPLATLGGDGLDHPPYDLSLGGPLFEEALVHGALVFLSACDGERRLREWRLILSSRFLNLGFDRVTGAALARHLARSSAARLDLASVSALLSTSPLSAAVGAGEAAKALSEAGRLLRPGENASPSEWAARITSALGAIGWARGFSLGSREFQAAEKFGEAVTALGLLDGVVPSCGYGRALMLLRSITTSPFRPKVGDVPIHVMGMLEAAGLEFTHLWVLGADELNLPPQARANPFIPYPVQLGAGLRQASPGEALDRARSIVERLKSSAAEVIFSSSAEKEGAHCCPSPLIATLPAAKPDFMADLSLPAQVAAGGRATLNRDTDESRPIAESEEIRGGSTLFAWQAQCPFRAYVGLRLGVEAVGEAEEGIDRTTQGKMLHLALLALHGIFHDHDSLRCATEQEIDQALEKAVSHGLQGAQRALPDQLLAVEAARMRETLKDWIEAELRRPEFKVVEREAVRRLLIGSIPVQLQLDRLDRTEGGDLILDYKTTSKKLSTASLTEERLTEPQLPLYALACDEAKGVAYAVMERGGCKLRGLAEGEVGPGVDARSDWEELKSFWRRKLHELGAEFESGRADPDPGGKREFCTYCSMGPVCRTVKTPDEREE